MARMSWTRHGQLLMLQSIKREREREGGYNFHGFDSRKSSNLDVPQVYWLTLYYIGYVWMAINNE